MNITANSRALVNRASIAPALIAATSRLFERIKESRPSIRIWHWIWHSKRSAAIQLTDLPTKRSGGEGGIRTTFGTVKIKKLQEKPEEAVPSRPLNSPDFAVDLAIAGYH
jgi:hypothetical protein